VVLATNQSGIGRGMFDMASLNAIHAKMHKKLAAVGARVDAVFFCPHAPEDGCNCRKPAAGLFEQVGARYGLPLSAVPAVGNALRHVQAGASAGCPAHLLLTGQSEHLRNGQGGAPSGPIEGLPNGAQVHLDLAAFADWLLAKPESPVAS
ncbi:MAG: HAD-IIIA family hydrolase, partial [Hydrogenophaga sp.]